MPAHVGEQLTEELKNPRCQPEEVEYQSQNAAALCAWLHALSKCYEVYKQLGILAHQEASRKKARSQQVELAVTKLDSPCTLAHLVLVLCVPFQTEDFKLRFRTSRSRRWRWHWSRCWSWSPDWGGGRWWQARCTRSIGGEAAGRGSRTTEKQVHDEKGCSRHGNKSGAAKR